MAETTDKKEQVFETDHWYAIFSGWLIIPAIVSLFAFLGALIMVLFVNPTKLTGFDLFIYMMDLIFLPLLFITFITWFKRKKIFPKLIIIFFTLTALFNVTYFAFGHGIDFINLTMSIVWIIYFIRSKRVTQTFTE